MTAYAVIAQAEAVALFPCCLIPIVLAISLGLTGLWIWMLVDCATNESDQGNDKIVWILVIALVGPIGALIYMFARRPERKRTLGR